MIRKAREVDLYGVSLIYEHIHQAEQAGDLTIGWIPGIYPVDETAEKAFERGDLFVYEEAGVICAAAIINQVQVPAYYDGKWMYEARDEEVMVLHALVVDPIMSGMGIGRKFVKYYEDYAEKNGCRILRMDTNAVNVKARRMYEKMGYREADIVLCEFNGIPDVQLVLLEKLLE